MGVGTAWVTVLVKLSAKVCSGMVQVLGYLTLMWETCKEFLAPDFSLSQL